MCWKTFLTLLNKYPKIGQNRTKKRKFATNTVSLKETDACQNCKSVMF